MGHSGSCARFADSGPKHMMMTTQTGAASSPTMIEIDWENEEHRRCITACLVQGTYLMKGKLTHPEDVDDSEPHVRAWWESFHFRLRRVLACVCNIRHRFRSPPLMTYGAIFEYVPPDGACRHGSSAPRYVVAFRGTKRRDLTTLLGDMGLNLRVLVNEQHYSGRFRHARKAVEELLNSIGPDNGGGGSCKVWLAGHSLGASIALDVGRHLMMPSSSRSRNLPAFLFNPPQVSLASLAPAIENVIPERTAEAVMRGVHNIISNHVRHDLGNTGMMRPLRENMEHTFEQLSSWVPNLYVHPRDVICSGYIYYFERRDRLDGAAATDMLSFRHMLRSAIGGGEQNGRPHLLPSAVLWTNQSSHGEAHELRQWWQSQQGRELNLTRRLYRWPIER